MSTRPLARTADPGNGSNAASSATHSGWAVPVAERTVFAIAIALGLLHAVDDALLHRQPGTPIGQHVWALLAAVAVGVLAIVVFSRLRPGLRAGLAVVLGAVTATNGAMHVEHIRVDSVAASDLTGVLAAVAGVVLIGLGAWIPFRHRGEGNASRLRRWINRGIAVVTMAVVVAVFVVPVGAAIVQTHKFREPIGDPPSKAFQAVSFESSDGLRLSGWYVASANKAAVIVVGGAGGDRMGSVQHAELLADHGYGVLLYDARGSGESEGSPNGWGWDWDRDVAGAIRFLQQRPDVDPTRIGALGLSTGADVLIEVATQDNDLKAVVADGSTARSYEDAMQIGSITDAPSVWAMYTAAKVLSGSTPGPPLKELVAEVSPTPLLLIAAGSIPQERPLNAIYADAAREPFELWELPDVHHTAAIREKADEYERRVIGFFDRALLEEGQP
jgi:uncharacterized protein